MQAKLSKEREVMLAEEMRIKAEAARIEEMMRQLDMDD